jgi:hypothetical protein
MTTTNDSPAVQYLLNSVFSLSQHEKEIQQITGERALADGFIRKGNQRDRKGEALYFALRDKSPITDWKAHYEPKDQGPLKDRKWANGIKEDKITAALFHQRESADDHIQPDEKIFDLQIHWEECRMVKLN